MAKLSKRLKKAASIIEESKQYSLDEAVSALKSYFTQCKTKFDETVEVALRLGVDAKQTDQTVRGVVPMPNGLGKKIRVIVFAKPDRVDEAKKAGADIAGSEELIDEVKNGRMDFDLCIATPDMMGKVGTLGKVLGPKGLMPNPKLGTVSQDITTAIKQAKAGQVEYKIDKAGIVHAGIGKLSFEAKAIKENILALYNAVLSSKPSNTKGIYLQKFYISTTMGPSIELDLQKVIS